MSAVSSARPAGAFAARFARETDEESDSGMTRVEVKKSTCAVGVDRLAEQRCLAEELAHASYAASPRDQPHPPIVPTPSVDRDKLLPAGSAGVQSPPSSCPRVDRSRLLPSPMLSPVSKPSTGAATSARAPESAHPTPDKPDANELLERLRLHLVRAEMASLRSRTETAEAKLARADEQLSGLRQEVSELHELRGRIERLEGMRGEVLSVIRGSPMRGLRGDVERLVSDRDEGARKLSTLQGEVEAFRGEWRREGVTSQLAATDLESELQLFKNEVLETAIPAALQTMLERAAAAHEEAEEATPDADEASGDDGAEVFITPPRCAATAASRAQRSLGLLFRTPPARNGRASSPTAAATPPEARIGVAVPAARRASCARNVWACLVVLSVLVLAGCLLRAEINAERPSAPSFDAAAKRPSLHRMLAAAPWREWRESKAAAEGSTMKTHAAEVAVRPAEGPVSACEQDGWRWGWATAALLRLLRKVAAHYAQRLAAGGAAHQRLSASVGAAYSFVLRSYDAIKLCVQ